MVTSVGYGLVETQFGFDWGPVSIERCVSDPKFGVVLVLRTNKETVDVRVTPTGLFRISTPEKRKN